MANLREFLSFLQDRYNSPFMIDGFIKSEDPVIRELHRVDHLYSIKFSLHANNTNDIIHIVEDWAVRANAEVKHIYWKDLDNIVTINYPLQYVEVASRSIMFVTTCGDYANRMGYRFRRG